MRVTEAAVRRAATLADTAHNNEQVTRKRVELLEASVGKLAGILGRGFVGRLKWLLLGR